MNHTCDTEDIGCQSERWFWLHTHNIPTRRRGHDLL